LKDVIVKVTRGMATLIDSGEATAGEVERVLQELKMKNTSTERPDVRFFVSDTPAKFTEIGERFLGRQLGVVKRVVV
jgi:glutamate racemase